METNVLYNEDCIGENGMCRLPDESVDSIVTDPPFSFAGGTSNGRSASADSQFFEHWMADVFGQLYRVSKESAAWFLWCDWRTIGSYENALRVAAPDHYKQRWITQVLIHDRDMPGMGRPFRNCCEFIALVRGKKTKFEDIPKTQTNLIKSYWYYGKHEHHPAEKDPKLTTKLIKWISKKNDTILDPFMGSGTTAIAAHNTGRKWIGFERVKEYYLKAKKRIELETAQKRLMI